MSWLSRNLAKLGSLDAMTDRQTGTVYYVGIGGDDNKDGKTWTNRRLTIVSGYGLCTNGDTLIIGPGTFTEDPTLDTDGVTIIGSGIGDAGSNGGTEIDGTTTVTAGRNIFKSIVFVDGGTAAPVVIIGNDANSNYNQFIGCKFIANSTCTAGIHIDGTTGGSDNIIKSCIFKNGNTANIIIDSGNAANNIIQDCLFEADNGSGGHGIHINDASAQDNIIKNCVINGNGTAGTGIYIQAGVDNYIVDCVVRDTADSYNIAANNYLAPTVGEWMTENLPTIDSADNDHMGDVIGNKTDTHDGDSVLAFAHTVLEHIHTPSEVLPTLADGIVVTSSATAWTLGAAVNLTAVRNPDVANTQNPGGSITRILSAAHGFNVGQVVTIAGTVSNNGAKTIVAAAAGTFDFDDGSYDAELFDGSETISLLIASDFDIHYISIENLSANAVYELVLYDDGAETGRVRFTKNANLDAVFNVPMQTVIIAADSIITAKLATNNAAGDTATISIFYHTY